MRVLLAGICNTDLEIVRGYLNFTGVPGHEFVGLVEESDNPALRGKRVTGEINAACGQCPVCKIGRPRHCPRRQVLGISGLDGCFAQYLVLPDRNLHPVPEQLSDQQAVFAEPVAAACRITEQVAIQPTDRVLVVGAGKLGLLVGQVLRVAGCRLEVLVRSKIKEELVARLEMKPIRALSLADRSYDVVVECSGNADGFKLACRAVRPRGTIVLKSTYQGNADWWAAGLVIDEITLVGSRCGPFVPALAMLKSGWINTDPLVEGRYRLAQGKAAFRRAGSKGALKVLIDPIEI